MKVNLHAIEPRSRANGPGLRYAMWFQGCTLGCVGCFNPDTHAVRPRLNLTVSELLERIEQAADEVEGLTVSGGEPFQQPAALNALLDGVRERTALSVLVFSGHTLEEIRRMPLGGAILRRIDVLVDGRYVDALYLGEGLRGSVNQRIHLLTSRYALADVEGTPACEVLIGPDGCVTVSGVAPLRVGLV